MFSVPDFEVPTCSWESAVRELRTKLKMPVQFYKVRRIEPGLSNKKSQTNTRPKISDK